MPRRERLGVKFGGLPQRLYRIGVCAILEIQFAQQGQTVRVARVGNVLADQAARLGDGLSTQRILAFSAILLRDPLSFGPILVELYSRLASFVRPAVEYRRASR